jgi:hypothetical protein
VDTDFQIGSDLRTPRRNSHASIQLTVASNSLDRVTNKVENDLFQLPPIAVQVGRPASMDVSIRIDVIAS